MKVKTVIAKNPVQNLCDTCLNTYPECSPMIIITKPTTKADNVIECSNYAGMIKEDLFGLSNVNTKKKGKTNMWQKILIEIAIRVIINWLSKQKETQPLVSGLIGAKSVDDLKNVLSQETTKDAIAEVIVETASEPVGDFIGDIAKKIFKK